MIKELLIGLKDKLIKQGVGKADLTILLEKGYSYLLKNNKNYIIKLVMDKFVPRHVRKFLQEMSNIDDVFEEKILEVVKKYDDDGIVQEALLYTLGVFKHLLTRMNEIFDKAVLTLKDKDPDIEDKIDEAALKVATDDKVIDNTLSELKSSLIDNGFESF